jgi:transposase InsO family protein
LNGKWISREKRDQVIDFVHKWTEKEVITQEQLLIKLKIQASKYYDWKARYGKKNRHNAPIPRWFWIGEEESQAVIAYYDDHPEEGYRRLSYMMLDEDVAAMSPSSVYRVLKRAGKLKKWSQSSSGKKKGFHQPEKAHQHWHIDVAYINLRGTFYYLCTVLDGYSRYVLHWEIRESMTEQDVEIVLQRAREKYPGVSPRVISDNGPQFVARDFKEFIRISGMTHVRTSFHYPQSNGKVERWYGSLRRECIRPGSPLTVEDARRIVTVYVEHYNNYRLHSALGYITPRDKLEGQEERIFAERVRKLQQGRERRRMLNLERKRIQRACLAPAYADC